MVGHRPDTQYASTLSEPPKQSLTYPLERDAVDADPDGQFLHAPQSLADLTLMRRNRRARGGPEGNIHIMGPVHPHRPAHNSPVYELHSPHAENTSRPRDRPVHFCWYVSLAGALFLPRGRRAVP